MEELMKMESVEVPTLTLEEWENLLNEQEKKTKKLREKNTEREKQNKRREEILKLMKDQLQIIDTLRNKSSLSGELSEEEWEILDKAMKEFENLEKDFLSI